MNTNIKTFLDMVNESNNIVFLGGAGVSTESGVPDFRSSDGIYNTKYKYRPEEILSHTFFENNTEEFFDFYKDKMIYTDVSPNITHKALAKLENEGKLKAVITQNIDGLHTDAGSKEVLELHGSVLRNYCMKCHKFYNVDYIKKSDNIPTCECGGIIKPDVVLYEEGLNQDVLNNAIKYIYNADMLIIGGTSLNVYPAAGLMDYYQGDKLILINKDATPRDGRANLIIRDNLGSVFKYILEN